MFQNSPEVDDEGYSIRPDEESPEADILCTAAFFFYANLLWLTKNRFIEL